MRYLLMLLCLACASNAEPERACTLIGCENGLTVVVNTTLQQDFTVNVKSGTQQIQTFTCRAGQPCQAFIANQTPAQVTVEVVSPTGATSRAITPEYSLSRPNGPDCPPECRQATVTVNVS
ncbi:MAG: hypothetical protein ACT4O1_08025 [Gemmatimonadota bacterium]